MQDRFGEAKEFLVDRNSFMEFCSHIPVYPGNKPDYDGLMVILQYPKAWDGYTVTRQYRGDTYRITVKNPNHVSCGCLRLRWMIRKYQVISCRSLETENFMR